MKSTMKSTNIPWSTVEQLLVETGKDQQWLKIQLDVESNVITNWKTRGVPTNRTSSLCKVFGVSPERLLNIEQAPKQPSNRIHAHHPEDQLPDEFVGIKESKVLFSGGPGHQINYELIEDSEPAYYRLSWFQKNHINPKRVKRFHVTGDSMEPMLYEGDTVLVNEAENDIIDGKLYAIRYGNNLRVKCLYRRIDGTLILHSLNQRHKDEEVSGDLANEHITIIGRVRDRSGSGGL